MYLFLDVCVLFIFLFDVCEIYVFRISETNGSAQPWTAPTAFPSAVERVVLNLQHTKTSARKGHLETVTVTEMSVVRKLYMYLQVI